MLHLIHPDLRHSGPQLAQNFARATPFRHVVIDNFLDPSFCAELREEFPHFDPTKAINETGAVGRKASVPDIARIGPAYRQFDALMKHRTFLQFIGNIAGIEKLLYDPAYIGGGTHENLEGQELDLHVDFNFHPKGLLHRRLNLIVFLNPEWSEAWGGCLELREDPWDASVGDARLIAPLFNRAVLFETTEHSWHGFDRIELPEDKRHLSRRSIAVYFYTRERPAEETAASHATVYIPRPLPGHLEAGYTLRETDIETLHTLIERRNSQIRFLSEREKKFTNVISGITASPAFRLGRLLTWPLRKLRPALTAKN